LTDPAVPGSAGNDCCGGGGAPFHWWPLLLTCRCMALRLENCSPHVAQVVLNLSTDRTSGTSVLPPALVLGSSGGDGAGLLDPWAVMTCGVSVSPPAFVLGSSGGVSDLLLAGVDAAGIMGIALDDDCRGPAGLPLLEELPPVTPGIGAGWLAGDAVVRASGGGAPAGAGVGRTPLGALSRKICAARSAYSRLSSCSALALCSGPGAGAAGGGAARALGNGPEDGVPGVCVFWSDEGAAVCVSRSLVVGGLVVGAGGMISGGIETSRAMSAGGAAGGGIGGTGGSVPESSPPPPGRGPTEAPCIRRSALSTRSRPSAVSLTASCILIRHCRVWPARVIEPSMIFLHPGQPGVAPWSSTSFW
jgi:hypothetical protein